MAYTSFTIKKDKKENRYRVYSTHKDGPWEGGGNFMDLYPVSGLLVAIKFTTKPVAVYKDIDHVCESLEKDYGVKPVVELAEKRKSRTRE